METYPFLKSKLIIPNVPAKTLFSQRIKELKIEDNRLVLLVAPAGFGKTTSILLSLESKRKNVRWYRLEREDTFLPLFYTHLIETIFAKDKEVKESNLHMLHSINNLEKEYVLLNAQICQDMAKVYKGEKSMYLVLDDFQKVVDKDAIIETVRYFVKNMPPCFSVIVASRVNPNFALRLSDQDKITQINSKDLLFTREEAEKLIREKYNINTTKKNIDLLYNHSEGWIAALNIMCHGVNFSKMELEKFQNKEDNVFSVYTNEFLKNLEYEKKKLLLFLSILEDFSVDELRIIFEIEDPLEFINWLEMGNIYIQKIMGETIRYRFHSLFKMELKRLFKQIIPLCEQLEFYNKLANYYEDREVQLSVRYSIYGNELNKAYEIAEKVGEEYFLSGKPEKMFGIINEFCEEEIIENPHLLLFKGMMLINTDRIESHRYFLQAIKKFRLKKEYSFLMNTFGMIMVVAFQSNDFSYLNDAVKEIPVTAIMLSGGPARSKLIVSRFIALTGEDNLKQALLLSKYIDRKHFREDMWQYAYLMIRGICYYRQGLLEESLKNLKEILSHPVALSNDQWRIIGLVSCCNVPMLLRDLDLLKHFEKEFLELGKKYKSDFSLAYNRYIKSFLKYQEGYVKDAIVAIDNSIKLYASYGAKALVNESMLVKILWEERQSEDVLSIAMENLEYFIRESAGHGLVEFAHTVVGVVNKRLKRWAEAELYLMKSLKQSKKINATQCVAGVYLQLSDLFFQKEDREKGYYYMEKWCGISIKNNYYYFYEMNISTLERVCREAEKNEKYKEYAQKLLSFYRLVDNKQGLTENTREFKVKLFGDFKLSSGDILITDSEFKTRKAGGILKYLLVNNEKGPVSREKLATIFWPESDSNSSSRSLRVALHELRKILSKCNLSIDKEKGFILETAEGLIVNPELTITSDIGAFENRYKQWKNNIKNIGEELEILKELYGLYTGEFLEQGYYEDWIGVLQNHYSSMFTEIVHSYGKVLFDKGKYSEAEEVFLKGMILDPLDEISCSNLIIIYRESGEVERANKLYKKFVKDFEKEMGHTPKLKIE